MASNLTILQMNDTHGYTHLHAEMFLKHGQAHYRKTGGYGRIASIFNQVRDQHPGEVLIFDNGDTFHGTYPVVETKGEGLIPIMNNMGIDAMTAHWEFAYGPAQFEKIVSSLNYPMLAINCYRENTNERVFPSHTVIDRAGIRIGVIGIAEHIVDKTMPAHFSQGIYFTLGNEELPNVIQELKEKENVDLIIVLSHLGFPQEMKLAAEVDGIDILLSGHTHNRLSKPAIVNDTILIQSGCHGSFIGKLDLKLENGRVSDFHHELIEVSEDISPDPSVQAKVDNLVSPYQEMLEKVVGQTETALNRYAQLETTMDNLLLQALIETTGAELAFSNGWRYGAPVPAGPVTMNDIWNIIPTNPPVSTVSITGAELLDMLEENLENTFSNDPYKQMGGYVKRCLGMKMFIKVENPKGQRIQDLFIGKERVDQTKSYQAAFVTTQGVPQKYGINRRNLDIHAVDALKQYIEDKGTVTAELRGTIELV